jgi:hypothetical protein
MALSKATAGLCAGRIFDMLRAAMRLSDAAFARRIALALALLIALEGPAQADAIDGNWCSQDGRTMIIDGARITIPSGKQIAGQYSRHYFSYVVPEGEPGAGATVDMVLLSEETMRLTRGVPPGVEVSPEPEIWRRCQPVA